MLHQGAQFLCLHLFQRAEGKLRVLLGVELEIQLFELVHGREGCLPGFQGQEIALAEGKLLPRAGHSIYFHGTREHPDRFFLLLQKEALPCQQGMGIFHGLYLLQSMSSISVCSCSVMSCR